ncbi:hypothetical protein CLU79DRAFT_765445 [Phycomyces nitens]|nr:hypothetical protein CLU79DRAFT_765445 [Phycomyces nitens]
MFTTMGVLDNFSYRHDYDVYNQLEHDNTLPSHTSNSLLLDTNQDFSVDQVFLNRPDFVYLTKEPTNMVFNSSQIHEKYECHGGNHFHSGQTAEISLGSSAYLSPLYTPMYTPSHLAQTISPVQNSMFVPLETLNQGSGHPEPVCENISTWWSQSYQPEKPERFEKPEKCVASILPDQGRRKRGRPPNPALRAGCKRHKCYFCPYKTDRINNFIRHIQSHTQCGEVWRCTQCPKSYCSKSNLVRHVKNIHK